MFCLLELNDLSQLVQLGGVMEGVNPMFAPYDNKDECTRADTVFLPLI